MNKTNLYSTQSHYVHMKQRQENRKMNSPFSPISSHDQLLEDQELVSDAKLIEGIGKSEVARV